MTQNQMTMQLTKKGLETVKVSKVTRDLVKNAFEAVQLPSSISVRQKMPIIIGEEALQSH